MLETQCEQLMPGQILAKNIVTASGAILMSAGTQLTRKNIQLLIKQKVKSVMLKPLLEPASNELVPIEQAPIEQAQLEEKTEQAFSLVNENPLMSQLKQAVLNHFRQKQSVIEKLPRL